MNTKNKKNVDYKKLRLTDNHLYESEEEEQQTSKKSTEADVNEMYELIVRKETNINNKLFKDYFGFQMPTAMLKSLHKLDNTEKNKELVSMIKSRLSDLKEKTENMSKKEKEIENIDKLIEIVEKITEFNKKTPKKQKDMF